MTRNQLATLVRANLDDAGVTFYSAAAINDSIQDAYARLVAEFGLIEKQTSVSFTSNLTYYDFSSLIPDFLAVTSIFNLNTKMWLDPVSTLFMDQLRWDWEIAVGTPQWFIPINFRLVAVTPHYSSATGTMLVFYKAQAPILGANDIIQIPDEYLGILESMATADGLEQSREFVKAQKYLKSDDTKPLQKRRLANPDRIMGYGNYTY